MGHLSRISWRVGKDEQDDLGTRLQTARSEILQAVSSAVRDGLPARGPRSGAMWTLRYFVRRVAWHVLDHAWEVEDRVTA